MTHHSFSPKQFIILLGLGLSAMTISCKDVQSGTAEVAQAAKATETAEASMPMPMPTPGRCQGSCRLKCIHHAASAAA